MSSVSVSGKSNGVRLHSAKAQTRKIKKPSGCTKKFQVNQPLFQKPCCCSAICLNDIVPVTISNATIDKPIASSYEITCDDARIAPSNENLLFEAQPPIIMP